MFNIIEGGLVLCNGVRARDFKDSASLLEDGVLVVEAVGSKFVRKVQRLGEAYRLHGGFNFGYCLLHRIERRLDRSDRIVAASPFELLCEAFECELHSFEVGRNVGWLGFDAPLGALHVAF